MELLTIAPLISAIVAFVSATYAGRAYIAARRERVAEDKRKLRESTLADIRKANAVFTDAMNATYHIARAGSPQLCLEFLYESEDGIEMRDEVFSALDELHFLSVGFIQGNYDEETFVLMLGSYYESLVVRLWPLVDSMRLASPLGNERLKCTIAKHENWRFDQDHVLYAAIEIALPRIQMLDKQMRGKDGQKEVRLLKKPSPLHWTQRTRNESD
jgi:hypothetical protein